LGASRGALVAESNATTSTDEQISFSEILEAGAKAIAIAIGFLHVSGLLMVNLYLLQFRADFSVLRIRYVSSGSSSL
jgi:hypothetical protein